MKPAILSTLCFLITGIACAQTPPVQNTTTLIFYDANGNLTQVTDPSNNITRYNYDGLRRLTRVTDPVYNLTQYAYDGLDQLIRVSDPRYMVTTYQYDGLGNQLQIQSPDTGSTNKIYDESGNLLRQTDAKGQTTSYQYDVLNRLLITTYSDGSKVYYTYDQGINGLGRLTQIADGNITLHYRYDQSGRLLSEQRTIDSVGTSTSYQYDSAGRLAGITYPSGRVINYLRDMAGQIKQISTSKDGTNIVLLSQISYQPFGAVASYVNGAQQTITRSFDLDGRMNGYTLAQQQRLLSYDASSRITSQGDGTTANTVTYGYDTLDRLTKAVAPSYNRSYTYDAVGNRTTLGNAASITRYTYSTTSNQLTQSSGSQIKKYISDANGSTINNGNNLFNYDVRGRMSSANTALGTVQYRINPLGQRVQKQIANSKTWFYYDANGQVIAESDGQNWKETVFLGDIPVAVLMQ